MFCLTFWLVLNIVSAKFAIRTNNFFTVLKVGLLLLLICVGFAGLSGRLPDKIDIADNFSFNGTLNNPGSYATAIYYVVFAYGGWSNLNYVLDELKDPIKNLPRCAISALSLTTVLYFLANVAYLAVLPVSVIKSSNLTVAANLFNTAFGGVFGGRVLPVLVGCSSFGFVGVIYYSGSRVVLEAARKGFLPFDRFFSKVHPKLQTPINSLVLLYLFSLVFLLAPPPGYVFEFIVAFSSYGDYFFSALSVIGLLILRRTQPGVKRPIRVPFLIAILFIAICFYTLVFVFVPPVSKPVSYPYYRKFCTISQNIMSFLLIQNYMYLVPYIITITLGIVSTGIWYYKVIYKNALDSSYNAEVKLDGQQGLFDDVYRDHTSSVSASGIGFIAGNDFDNKSIHHAEVRVRSK